MNEKQVKLNEFMIAFEKKSSLVLISATAVKVTFMKKHPEASVLSILKLASPLSMHNACDPQDEGFPTVLVSAATGCKLAKFGWNKIEHQNTFF